MKDITKQTVKREASAVTSAETEIIMSHRVRLARNISGFIFPQWAKPDSLNEIGAKVEAAINESALLEGYKFCKMSDLTPLMRRLLTERHIISPHFTSKPEGRFLAYNKNKSIMINEEDHIRIQVLGSGLSVEDSWHEAKAIDEEIEKHVEFAFSEDWGYLTACPTNVGSAIRVSIMLHLPALVMTKQLHTFFQAVLQTGIVVRGLFGEGTQAAGNIYQISNGVTLGRDEPEILEHVKLIGQQIANKEKTARKVMAAQDKDRLRDTAFRALGILKFARMLDFNESMELLSMLRFGIDMELVNDIEISKINDLMIKIRPAHLMSRDWETLEPKMEMKKRAELIRQVFN